MVRELLVGRPSKYGDEFRRDAVALARGAAAYLAKEMDR
jgi:hypothetical protein